MKKPVAIIALVLAALMSTALPAQAVDRTLTMDELLFQPIDGLSYAGVTFHFTVNGLPSIDAHYNSGGPGQITYVQDPSIEGDASGILQVDFAQPTPYVGFGVAISSFNSLSPGFSVGVYDDTMILVGQFDVDTLPLISFTEGQFTYTGSLVSRIVVTFNHSALGGPRFAFDNLNYDDGTAAAVHTSNRTNSAVSAHWQS
jgi:hypothetical protein